MPGTVNRIVAPEAVFNMQQTDHKQNEKNKKIKWLINKGILVVFDLVAVNLSYFLALFFRFFINNQFRPVADQYIPVFREFAPFYTGICLITFFAFRLYSSTWKYAGINDFNRILFANLVTAAAHVAGTLIFWKRMPITYYFLGAVIQLILIVLSRFVFRLASVEKNKLARKGKASLNVMIAGVGETAGIVRRQIENSQENVARPVVMFSHRDGEARGMMDGIPVVGGMDRLKDAIEKYHVECLILADSLMPEEIRKKIKEICREANTDVQDFSGYFQNEGGSFSLKRLLEYTTGPVTVVTEGKAQTYENGEQALMAQTGKSAVRMVSANDGRLVIEISSKPFVLNDVNQDWVKDVEQETGEAISFF